MGGENQRGSINRITGYSKKAQPAYLELRGVRNSFLCYFGCLPVFTEKRLFTEKKQKTSKKQNNAHPSGIQIEIHRSNL